MCPIARLACLAPRRPTRQRPGACGTAPATSGRQHVSPHGALGSPRLRTTGCRPVRPDPLGGHALAGRIAAMLRDVDVNSTIEPSLAYRTGGRLSASNSPSPPHPRTRRRLPAPQEAYRRSDPLALKLRSDLRRQRADGLGESDRRARRLRCHQLGDRDQALPQREDRRGRPHPGLPQARGPLTRSSSHDTASFHTPSGSDRRGFPDSSGVSAFLAS